MSNPRGYNCIAFYWLKIQSNLSLLAKTQWL